VNVIDQYRDPVFAVLIKAVEGRPKLAAAVDIDVEPSEAEGLPDTAFAWPEKRAYPIHSREHAMLSRIYREAAGGPLPVYVDQAIKEAFDVYGVDETLFERQKVASAPRDDSNDFLLPEARRLRVTEVEHVKTAEAKLINEGAKLTPGSRMLASARLVEKAAQLGVRVQDITRKMAGMTVTSTDTLARWLEARATAAPLDHRDGYQKLANETKRMQPELRDRNVQMKLAMAIEELDEACGLDKHWGRRLPDPVSTVFNTEKVAGPGVMLAGRFMPMERMAAYPSSFYSDVLGDDIMREANDGQGQLDLHKLAAVLGTLPADMQRVLAQQMG
jgi:hypothetical protein